MKTSEILIAAKALIDTPEKWTQGAYARDKSGNEVDDLSDQATCFCSLGALGRVEEANLVHPLNRDAQFALRKQIDPSHHFRSISNFNDNRTHAEVMEVWDKAIAERVAAGD